MALNTKDQYLHIRISAERKKQLFRLSEFVCLSSSSYLDRLIESTYFKFFDKEGNFIADNKTY